MDTYLARALSIVKTLEQKDYSSTEELIDDICILGGISREELIAGSKKQEYALVRQAAYYLLRNKNRLTSTHAGKLMNKDHGTILFGTKKMKGYLELYGDKITPFSEEEMRKLGINTSKKTSEETPASNYSKKEAMGAVRQSLEQLAKDVGRLERLLAGEDD